MRTSLTGARKPLSGTGAGAGGGADAPGSATSGGPDGDSPILGWEGPGWRA